MQNKISRARKLGTLHTVAGAYWLFFLIACVIITLTATHWIPQDTEDFEGLGYAFGLIFFIIFGGIGYGIVGMVNAIVCLIHGARLRRTDEQKELGRRSLIACFVCKLLALAVALGTCVLCTSLLSEINVAIGIVQAVLAAVGMILLLIACIKEAQLWRLPKETAETAETAETTDN